MCVNKIFTCYTVQVLFLAVCTSLLMFFAVSQVYAAGVAEIDWSRQYGSSAADSVRAADSNGYLYVAGAVGGALPNESHQGNDDAFIRKYDRNGTVLWTEQFGSAASDQVTGIAVTESGIFVTGLTDGTIPGTLGSNGGRDAFLLKYDSNGDLKFGVQFGTVADDEALTITADGGFLYIGGRTNGTFSGESSLGSYDAFVIKYSDLGTFQWVTQFGSSQSDQVLGVTILDDQVYLVGSTGGILPGEISSGLNDAYIQKLGSNGNLLWTDQFGTAGFDLALNSVTDGTALYLVGDIEGTLSGQTANGSSDPFIRKYTVGGNVVWTDQFGTAGFDEAYAIAIDDSGVYVGGFVEGALPGQNYLGGFDAYARKYDFVGNELWTHQFGTTESEDILGLAVDNYAVFLSGSTNGTFAGESSSGSYDAYTVRINQDSDDDDIFDEVDTEILTTSDAFSDGETFGTISTRGDQILTVRDATNTNDGVWISADLSGGVIPAEISECGIGTTFISPGDSIVVTCGSISVNVLEGTVEISLTADDGRVAETTLFNGDSLTFESETATVSAPPTNINIITVTVGNEMVAIGPGATEEIPVDVPIVLSSVTLTPSVMTVGETALFSAVATAPENEASTLTDVLYSIDGSTYVQLTPDDGSYDSVVEGGSTSIGPFSEAGVHEVCAKATDTSNSTSQKICLLLAVYDSDAGYVTGGGWIDSPVGAYPSNPSLIGKAHFGFVSEYEEGVSIPSGNTQFRFNSAGLKFKSDTYDWLVVGGSRAQFKGSGTINNSGAYKFLLTALDGDVITQNGQTDAFRMKIWDAQSGTTIYDNKLEASDTGNAMTELGAGSITIHTE